MSNPGVIVLAELRNVGPNLKRLDIEDNIGEAIHIHLNTLRCDLTVSAFLALAEECSRIIERMKSFEKFSLTSLDPYFLFRMGPLVSEIERVEIQNRRLRDLICLTRTRIPGLGSFLLPARITRTPAYRYLKGDRASFLAYEQDSYPGLDNETRMENLSDSIRKYGYPDNYGYIVLFGDQNYVRDGQHRAACLVANGGADQTIPVLVIQFAGRRWRLHPYRSFARAAARALVSKSLRKMRNAWRAITGAGY